jgi:Flp pilus assembly protein CpaB
MKGGRLIVFAGVAMGLLAGALVIVLMMSQRSASAAAVPTPEPPSVVRAAQNISRGDEIPLDAVQLVRLEPGEPEPPSVFNDPMLVVGMTAAMDIPQGTIVQETMLIDREALAEEGKSASRLFEPGRVAVVLPVGNMTGVAGAIKVGDHVDIIAAFELLDVDPAKQAVLPLDGSTEQLSRLVVQLTLQDVEVLRVGLWGTGPDPNSTETKAAEASPGAAFLTILVTPQDAIVVDYILEKMQGGQTRFSLALRAEDDREVYTTDPATLDYLMKRFGIIAPPKSTQTLTEIPETGSVEPR